MAWPGTAIAGSPASPGKGRAPVEWPRDATIDRIVWGRDREGQFPIGWRPSITSKSRRSPVSGASLRRRWIAEPSTPGNVPAVANPCWLPSLQTSERICKGGKRSFACGWNNCYARSRFTPARSASPERRTCCAGRPDAAHDRGCRRRHRRRAPRAWICPERSSRPTGGSRWQNGLEILRTRCLRG